MECKEGNFLYPDDDLFPQTLLIRAVKVQIFLLKPKDLAETHTFVFRNDILYIHRHKQSVF